MTEDVQRRLETLETQMAEIRHLLFDRNQDRHLRCNLPMCPECGFLLMADEAGDNHLQCYACGCWWDIHGQLTHFEEETGWKKKLPAGIVPNRRRRNRDRRQ